MVSTDDGYADPNGRMHDYGDKKYGLTGDSHGWRHDYVDLARSPGRRSSCGCGYATDAAFLERGWFADDFSVTGGGATTWSDDVEARQRLDADGRHLHRHHRRRLAHRHRHRGPGALLPGRVAQLRRLRQGPEVRLRHHLLATTRGRSRRSSTTPRACWCGTATRRSATSTTSSTNLTALPSDGLQGRPAPRRLATSTRSGGTGVAADKDPSTLNNLPSRPQSSNAAFGLQPDLPVPGVLRAAAGASRSASTARTSGRRPGVKTFTDAKGWYPGIEVRAIRPEASAFFFRDVDASTVVPSVGNAPYSTRVVDANGNPLPAFYGADLGRTSSWAPATRLTTASRSGSHSRSRTSPRTRATPASGWCPLHKLERSHRDRQPNQIRDPRSRRGSRHSWGTLSGMRRRLMSLFLLPLLLLIAACQQPSDTGGPAGPAPPVPGQSPVAPAIEPGQPTPSVRSSYRPLRRWRLRSSPVSRAPSRRSSTTRADPPTGHAASRGPNPPGTPSDSCRPVMSAPVRLGTRRR